MHVHGHVSVIPRVGLLFNCSCCGKSRETSVLNVSSGCKLYTNNQCNCSNLLLHGKIKKVPSHAHMCSLEQRARNAHGQNEQTLTKSFDFITCILADLNFRYSQTP